MRTKHWMAGLLVLALVFTLSPTLTPAQSGAPTRPHKYNLLGESVGLLGYDPVSYFPEGGPSPRRG